MRGDATIIEIVLILAIGVVMVALAIPVGIDIINKSQDTTEFKTMQAQLRECNEKILDTARTGTLNKCIFSISRGKVTADVEGVHYTLVTSADVCDTSDWVEIDADVHLWQRCNVTGKQRFFEMKFSFPAILKISGQSMSGNFIRISSPNSVITDDINFDPSVNFITFTLYINFDFTPGISGKVVEVSRESVGREGIRLKVKIS